MEKSRNKKVLVVSGINTTGISQVVRGERKKLVDISGSTKNEKVK